MSKKDLRSLREDLLEGGVKRRVYLDLTEERKIPRKCYLVRDIYDDRGEGMLVKVLHGWVLIYMLKEEIGQ